MQINKIAYHGWENAYELQNGVLRLIVTADVGPRILHFAHYDSENTLHIVKDDLTSAIQETHFRLYGGHRLWRAPEDPSVTYFPDNRPVDVEVTPTEVTFSAPTEPGGLQKQFSIALNDDSASIIHRFFNHGTAQISNIALWAITMLRAGGFGLIPVAEPRAHTEYLLPTQHLVLWGYTDLSDTRWLFAPEFIGFYQDENKTRPQKIGHAAPSLPMPWLAYIHPLTGTFIKRVATPMPVNSLFPDNGARVELFSNEDMLELETLGPLQVLEPGESIEHVEQWQHIPAEKALPQNRDDARELLARLQAIVDR